MMRLERVSHFDVLRSLCQPRESWDVKACDVIARIVCHMCDVIPSLGFCASLNFVTFNKRGVRWQSGTDVTVRTPSPRPEGVVWFRSLRNILLPDWVTAWFVCRRWRDGASFLPSVHWLKFYTISSVCGKVLYNIQKSLVVRYTVFMRGKWSWAIFQTTAVRIRVATAQRVKTSSITSTVCVRLVTPVSPAPSVRPSNAPAYSTFHPPHCSPGAAQSFIFEIVVDVGKCSEVRCENNGICEERNGDFHCRCQFGFTGRLCHKRERFLPIWIDCFALNYCYIFSLRYWVLALSRYSTLPRARVLARDVGARSTAVQEVLLRD